MSEKKQQSRQKSRRSSWSSNQSFHSIDEFRISPFEMYGKTNRFPIRPMINILLIFLATFQVLILVNSRIYLRGQLVRTFLSVYVDQGDYPQLFSGEAFYLNLMNVSEFKDHFEYMFHRINTIDEDSFIELNYNRSKILLHSEFRSFGGNQHRDRVIEVDPKAGIVKPFNMTNTTDIQLYLLKIEQFTLRVENLQMKENWEGFSEKYIHEISYRFVDSIKVEINFEFRLDNAMINEEPDEKRVEDVPYPTVYIIKVRAFYAIIMIMAIISLYLNYLTIRKTYKVLYEQLGHEIVEDELPVDSFLVAAEEIVDIKDQVKKWVKVNKITIYGLKSEHYFNLLEFDVIFSTLADIFLIINGCYLISGIESERMAGIACLFSWLTIFKFIRKYKRLVLMYELIKLSIAKVFKFFIQFLPCFLCYVLLGICLFPKVTFFSSLADSVTTLVSLMMGDSIEMITVAIIQKNSVVFAILYIFSFVLLFMHAIHNTLTSIIKEFFIMKKIELINIEKEERHEEKFVYIQELKCDAEQRKSELPLKLTSDLQKSLLRIRTIHRSESYQEMFEVYNHEIECIIAEDKQLTEENNLFGLGIVKEQLVRRSFYVSHLLDKLSKKKSNQLPRESGLQQSMLTDGK